MRSRGEFLGLLLHFPPDGDHRVAETVEILNSAVEAVVDRSGTERHPLAGMAKDMGSAAVMLSFALLGTVWLLVLSDRH